ncbi:MAG: Si-specific NAD(P)(+) transhydrogenase [Acidobacteriota bacterium]|jgi:NAD(P) transhydrogenase|nr:Si-specific NAD(P)(+) transhydrogenase [Bryobacteraceae bacterium CoA2 C42]MCA2966192.1 Si-specific NAD(P)(+) transhydrogenase [Acidobacteriaceae bacterium]
MVRSSEFDYDLVVIGSGPGGQRAAIQAAKLDKRVALIEKKAVVGGTCINTGTIPSKTLREAVLHLSGYREKGFYGASYTVKQHITMEDLLFRTTHVIGHEQDISRHQLQRNGVDLLPGTARFTGAHTLRVQSVDGHGHQDLSAEKIIIAVGTTATRCPGVDFDGQSIFTSDEILSLDQLPKTMAIVGAGVIGTEYTTIFSTLGVRVTLIDKRPILLDFVDDEIADSLAYQMRENRVTLRLGEDVTGIERAEDEHGKRVKIQLASGKQVIAEKLLYSVGRTGNTEHLGLEAAGLTADDRGRIKVNPQYQTAVPHIYAVGDVIGFPSLASTSMEQGRLAACHAFGVAATSVPSLFPYGIYTIPEISMVGRSEEELTKANIPYEIGKAHYREIARGQILGDASGILKLIFHQQSRQLLGVHIMGEGASELVHIGQAVLSFGGTIDYFINTVFNYPTLAECYKVAAFDGINRLGL